LHVTVVSIIKEVLNVSYNSL